MSAPVSTFHCRLSVLGGPSRGAQKVQLEKKYISISVGGSISQMNKVANIVALNKNYFDEEGLSVGSTALAFGAGALAT